jgi:CheY-like chemotaxis protein
MSKETSQRILVADDDLGVIAAYRHVLEGSDSTRYLRYNSSNGSLEDELFGTSSSGASAEDQWRVHFVDQGQDAVNAVRQSISTNDPFTAVFLDIRMPPGLDGFETAARIRKLDPMVHIVFVSGYSDYDEKDLIEVAGPEHRVSFLPKPVWPLQLKSKALAICRDARLIQLCREARMNRMQARQCGH